jgi:hypothetical protein
LNDLTPLKSNQFLKEIDLKSMADCARMCAVQLENLGCDFTLLFWLKHANLLPASEFGRDLLSTLGEIGVDVNWLADPVFYREFFQQLRLLFNEKGLNPVQKDNFCMDMGIGGKERVLEASKGKRWPRPHQTYIFQTRGDGISMFFVYQCWQDGLRMVRKILKARGYLLESGKLNQVAQVYEHCWGDTRLTRMLIDWEVESPWMDGQRTVKEVKETAEAFPSWFVGQLRRVGALDPLQDVRCVVKDKTRRIEGGEKVSFHFILGIAGFPKGAHKMACLRVISGYLPWMKVAHEVKSFKDIDAKDLALPVVGVDWRTVGGSHGFSTPLSKKKDGDPDPIVSHALTLGKKAEREEFSFGSSSLVALYQASYTTPSPDTVGYCPEFLGRDLVLVSPKARCWL